MAGDRGEEFIRHRRAYVERTSYGLSYYEAWVADESGRSREFPNQLRVAALKLLHDQDESVRLSALQALACVGTSEDVGLLRQLGGSVLNCLQAEVLTAVALIEYRNKSIETLLDEVNDRKSFIDFARALAKERKAAQEEEAADPSQYVLNGARGWNNSDISSYIYSALTEFEGTSSSETLSWHRLARFLYLGKILE